jgi:hypothetical protein
MNENFEIALKGLDKASEIAVKLGMFHSEVDRLRELEIKQLHHYFQNRE